ncbi:cysteine-rich secretory protein LCCL domain-containing 2 [Corynascus novoguineensis]|uniref:Cysteine-rich secretory protein LCCL domain-containing 2 n=1 Tax=Corynascus novoguineensis TaxID=1126955 RepID=A0AAN7CRW3_9PEZI|nr:cysteine-rich secretory protein LCCL domain-containing 2 [Corynascus novoguineensis]
MGGNKPTTYGQDREDEVEVHPSEGPDEEALLLNGEDDEQFELDDLSPPEPSREASRRHPRSRGSWARRRMPTWLAFFYGPDPPEIQTIHPIFSSVQEIPVRWFRRVIPQSWQRMVVLVLFSFAWAASLAVPLTLSKGTATDAAGSAIRHVDCIDTLWKRDNECSIDGVDCRPFFNTSFALRCPADCAGVRLLNPHHVGNQDVNFRPLVVGGGGGNPYRGDSFLCGAAIHAGVIGDATGGCGRAILTGEYYHYFSSSQHGIDSIPFDSYFPLSFTVEADPTVRCTMTDPRWTISLPLSLVFTTLLSLFTTSRALFFFATFLGIFTHVALISDPPNLSTPSTTDLLPALVSHYASRLLPALFFAAILYLTCVRRALPAAAASTKAAPLALEKTVLWLFPFWLGALSNRTIEPLVPIARLTPTDLAGPTARPGAALALVVITALVLVLAICQARTLHREGRLPFYLALYAAFAFGLAFLAAVAAALPGLHLRLHHYVFALLLLPGTAAQTRLSWACQGLLLGLFVNGAARWGFDSVLQTDAVLLRGDEGGPPSAAAAGLIGSALLPEVVPPLIERLAIISAGVGAGVLGREGEGEKGMRIWFKWRALPGEEDGLLETGGGGRAIKGISVLVNDVERYRGWFAERPLEEQVFKWTRRMGRVVADEYFRFGFVTEGGRALGYTEAGTWFVNGSWSQGAGYW